MARAAGETYLELKRRLAEIHDLGKAAGLLAWDQRTQMPARGAPARAEQLATLSRHAHELFVAEETETLLDELSSYEESLPHESDEASLIRVARRDFERARRVPGELRSEISRAASSGYVAWVDARARSDYESFLPYLQRNLELKQRYAECFDDVEDPYDALLDDYEPGMTTAEVREVFDILKPELIALMRTAAEHGDAVDASFLHGSFPKDAQRRLSLAVLGALGYEPDSWRLDETEHPFASSISVGDIRLTTRFKEHLVSDALFSTMHEFGHGIYERNVDPALERTLLCRGASMSLHESQSRLWENLVGRSRPFWHFFYPTFRSIFPELDVGEADFYRAVNQVKPSLTRVESDEVTYSLHIILRFELEQELLSGELGLRELPEAWNARMEEYLGVTVPDDARGVLQDTHWSAGSLGYFPTYALGNVISLQIWEQLLQAIPDLSEQIGKGEFGELRAWLREHLYRHGRKFMPKELLERITGGGLDPQPYLRYLRDKVGEIYGIQAPLGSGR